jgi:hypothetical protein
MMSAARRPLQSDTPSHMVDAGLVRSILEPEVPAGGILIC